MADLNIQRECLRELSNCQNKNKQITNSQVVPQCQKQFILHNNTSTWIWVNLGKESQGKFSELVLGHKRPFKTKIVLIMPEIKYDYNIWNMIWGRPFRIEMRRNFFMQRVVNLWNSPAQKAGNISISFWDIFRLWKHQGVWGDQWRMVLR